MNGFKDALDALAAMESSGVDVYEACVAKELAAAIESTARRMVRKSKKAKARLVADGDGLFRVAMSALRGSRGASSPRDVALCTVATYMENGMDIAATMESTKDENFVIGHICDCGE